MGSSSYCVLHGNTLSWNQVTPGKWTRASNYVLDERLCPCGLKFMGHGNQKYCCDGCARIANNNRPPTLKALDGRERRKRKALEAKLATAPVCVNPGCGRRSLGSKLLGACSVTCYQLVAQARMTRTP